MSLEKFELEETFEELKRAELEEGYQLPSKLADEARLVSAAMNIMGEKRALYWQDKRIIKEMMIRCLCDEKKARKSLRFAKQLLVFLNPVNQELEKIRLIDSIKTNAMKSSVANTAKDRQVISAEHKNLIKLLGLDKEQPEQNSAGLHVIIINHDPSLLGGQKRPNLLQDIAKELRKIEKQQETDFTDFEMIDDED
ncbi:hypothetical protein [Runella zeae]|uniref:hypothetical protein n=1 Tax=Runella zeae TaxID=94255 RepID=UPI0004187512|nr:hypothetical protein [Runella zeae]